MNDPNYQYLCKNNCLKIFESLEEFNNHVSKCRSIFQNKPHFKPIPRMEIGVENKGDKVPGRMQPENYKWAARFISLRDGYQCIHCLHKPARGDPPLEIDHANGNEHDNCPENLHWLCKNCNLLFRQYSPVEHQRIIAEDSAKNVGVCKEKPLAAELYQSQLNTDDVSLEIKINIVGQPAWEKWIEEKIGREGLVTKFDSIYGGAKAARVSPRTTERYFKMSISCEGEYEYHPEKGGYITRRE